ncbi:MAG: hypothetical protein OXG72_07975, partial [Acidobacteria bacterium]|nr:hypothetical protein [Acidobacteriota bacterium]
VAELRVLVDPLAEPGDALCDALYLGVDAHILRGDRSNARRDDEGDEQDSLQHFFILGASAAQRGEAEF